jgi:hypothetical protein
VTTASSQVNSLSSSLGGLSGTNLAINGTQTINESSGVLQTANGITYRVFNVTSYSESNSGFVTIAGDGSGNPVVLNFKYNSNVNLSGQVVLNGGLTNDQVFWNFTSIGKNIGLTNNGGTFQGIILVPKDVFNSDFFNLYGRVYGGSAGNMQIVTGGNVYAPVTMTNTAMVSSSNATISTRNGTSTTASSVIAIQPSFSGIAALMLTATPNPSTFGTPVNLMLTITPVEAGSAQPGGTVTFVVDGEARGTVPVEQVSGAGVASLTVDDLGVGSHLVEATYSGDSVYQSAQASETVTVQAAPGGPQVDNVQRFGFHMKPTTLVLTFSAPLDAASATDLANYQLLVQAGRHPVRITSATLEPDGNTVILRPARLLPLKYHYQLTVIGTPPGGVRDEQGRYLDGTGQGQPGTNYTVTITRRDLAGPQAPRAAKRAAASHSKAASPVPHGSARAWHLARTHRSSTGQSAALTTLEPARSLPTRREATAAPSIAHRGLDSRAVSGALIRPLDAKAVDLVFIDSPASDLIGKRSPVRSETRRS